MRKASIRNGDPTSTGGYVIAGFGTAIINGERAAVDGDIATRGNCSGSHKILGSRSDTEPVLGCVPNPNESDGTAAHVCGPDTATHTIAIHEKFCTLPDTTVGTKDSKQLTLIHECCHFYDTFAAIDYQEKYYGKWMARRLAKEDPRLAIRNADNVAWYICATDTY